MQKKIKKRNNQKKIAAILAGSLITCALNTDAVSASTLNNLKAGSNINAEDNSPIIKPEEIQILIFDKANPNDLIIKDINFKGIQLSEFLIGTVSYDLSNLAIGNNSITISKDFLSTLNLPVGSHSVGLKFADSTISIGCAYINVVDSSIVPPSNNENGSDEDNKDDTSIISNPSIKPQNLTYDIYNPSSVTVTDVNFDNSDLSYIYINGNLISCDKLIIDKYAKEITIPVTVLNTLKIAGVYDISFKFSNGTVISQSVYIDVKNSAPSVPPSGDDNTNTVPTPPAADDTITVVPPSVDNDNNISTGNPDINQEVIFDKNNPASIEVTDFVPADSKINTLKINGIEFPVVYMNDSRIAKANLAPEVYIVNNKLIIPISVIEYIGTHTSKYVIEAELDNGTTLSRTLNLNIVDSSDKSEDIDDTITVVSPVENNTDNSDKNNKETASEEKTPSVNKVSAEKSTPKTGTPAAAGILTSLMTAASGLILSRKKK